MLSLNIDHTQVYLENQKLELILRLIKNGYTKGLLLENLEGDGLKNLWGSTAHIFEDHLKTLDEIVTICQTTIYLNKVDIESEKKR